MSNKLLPRAFKATLPVLTGYMVLGAGFGMVLKAKGFGFYAAPLMSIFIYAGSMQFAALDLLAGGASYITLALTTLAVNARHLFYGISMIDKYKHAGRGKPYLIFALTDETYSLVCNSTEGGAYFLTVSLLDQLYWVTGSIIGAGLGELLTLNTTGMDFALTALFVTILTDSLRTPANRLPAAIGVGASLLCVLIFGADSFLIPAMLIISAGLLLMGRINGYE